MTGMKSTLAAALVLLAGLAGAASAGDGWHEPARGSAERRAIMDAMRPAFEARLNPPVQFVVRDLRVLDGWAFAQVMPQRPGGRAIDLARTPLADEAEFMDGIRSEAILQRRGGGWRLREHAIGATDVWFVGWCQRLPRGLLDDYCD